MYILFGGIILVFGLSFRLLSYAESAIKREPISSWFDVGANQEEKDILQSLTKAFEVKYHLNITYGL